MAEKHVLLVRNLVIPKAQRLVLAHVAQRCNEYGEMVCDYMAMAADAGHTNTKTVRQTVLELERLGALLRRFVIVEGQGQQRNLLFLDSQKLAGLFAVNPLARKIDARAEHRAQAYRTTQPALDPLPQIREGGHVNAGGPLPQMHEGGHVNAGGGPLPEMRDPSYIARACAVGSVINLPEREREPRARDGQAVENSEAEAAPFGQSRYTLTELREFARWQQARDGRIESVEAVVRSCYADGSADSEITEYFKRKANGTLSQTHAPAPITAPAPKQNGNSKTRKDTVGLNTAPAPAANLLSEAQAVEALNIFAQDLPEQLPQFVAGTHAAMEYFPPCPAGQGWRAHLATLAAAHAPPP